MHLARRLPITVIVAFALFGALAPVTHSWGRVTKAYAGANAVNTLNVAGHFGSAAGSVISPSAVATGVVYVGSEKVYALKASTGAKIWSYTTGGNVESSPAVVNGVVYVGSVDHR